MDIGLWTRLAFREISNSRRFSALFVFNLVLGLSGFVALDAFKASIQKSLESRSKLLLSADAVIRSQRPLSSEEEQAVLEVTGREVQSSNLWSLYSMASGSRNSRLTEITAVDDAYPFYGEVKLTQGAGQTKALNQEAIVWVTPEVAAALQIRLGDPVKLGDASFKVADQVTSDPGGGGRLFDLAPRLYMGQSQLASTHLILKGSRVYYNRLLKLRPDQDADAVAKALNARLSDPGVQAESARQSSESVGRLQGFLNDYLGLAALVALFLAALGAGYLFRSFLSGRLKEIAILRSLGVPSARAQTVYQLQLALLGATAGVVSTALALLLLPATIRLLGGFLAYPVEPVIRIQSLFVALAIGIIGSLLVCRPFLRQISRLNPSALFQEDASEGTEDAPASARAFLPALGVYWLLAVWSAHSWKVGSLFIGLFLGAGLLLGGTGWLLLRVAARLPLEGAWRRRHILRTLTRGPMAALSVFLALGLGTLLLSLIPQVQKSLETEIEKPAVSTVPGLFLFDVQPPQVEPLKSFVAQRGFALSEITPLIQSRLQSVNGKAFEKVEEGSAKTREKERDNRFRNRGFRLTTRSRLSESESIVKGRDFNGAYAGGDTATGQPAEISVEEKFAQRMGFTLGDVLAFDIQGVTVRGRIVNLRKVQWASFQPNFFVQFQPGVLEAAPATFLASVAHLDPTQRILLQNAIVARFPNISLIDVSSVVQKILDIFNQMGWAIRLMALFSLSAGLLVLFSIANHQAQTRRQETTLLKVLGARFADLQALYAWEFGLLALAAALVGTLLSLVLSYGLSRLLFENVWVFSWVMPLILMAATPLVSVLTVRLATRRILQTKPLALLQSAS